MTPQSGCALALHFAEGTEFGLEPKQCGTEIALGQRTGVCESLLVEQQVSLPWAIAVEHWRRRLDERLERVGSMPRRDTFVEHHGQNRRQTPRRT
ncbi:MAG: hypothetical protein KFB96_06910 [Thiocapsa sp.]|uniref:hypothetical protein n=1 Tax=Thiocapsa sp. TaxID=2024551 RepID=UPI001BCFA72F|nr:hypothetical protein [Thiocapsa sp.]QVL50182.1 MAG: hypothetical protein KFB96_06910 [Thiocapsa sp.]